MSKSHVFIFLSHGSKSSKVMGVALLNCQMLSGWEPKSCACGATNIQYPPVCCYQLLPVKPSLKGQVHPVFETVVKQDARDTSTNRNIEHDSWMNMFLHVPSFSNNTLNLKYCMLFGNWEHPPDFSSCSVCSKRADWSGTCPPAKWSASPVSPVATLFNLVLSSSLLQSSQAEYWSFFEFPQNIT